MNGQQPALQTLTIVADVTVSCHAHGSHVAQVRGAHLEVLEMMELLAQVCAMTGRRLLVEYRVLDHEEPLSVSEWD